MIIFLYLFRPDPESDSEAEDVEHAEKLRQVKAVLEEVINSLDCVSSEILISMFCIMNLLVTKILKLNFWIIASVFLPASALTCTSLLLGFLLDVK